MMNFEDGVQDYGLGTQAGSRNWKEQDIVLYLKTPEGMQH
jgi:hypothetical protein